MKLDKICNEDAMIYPYLYPGTQKKQHTKKKNAFQFQSTAVDAVVFRGLVARDPDSNVNGQVEYFIENETESPFKIDLPHQGIVRLAKPLDYETERIHFVTIVARVRFFTHNISY